MEIKDEKIIADFLGGDEKSFEFLVKKYLKPIYNFVYQFTRDRAVTDDLTQETFLKVWKSMRKFNRSKSFKTWIFTIAKNTTYDYFKKKKTLSFSNFLDAEGNNRLENTPDGNLLPDEMFIANEAKLDLDEKLKKIPATYRLILVLHYKEDFSLMEIAEILQLPYNTVKSGHSRALQALKKQLRPQ